LELHNLTALSPIDGRYSQRPNIVELRDYMSEFGLIKYRVIVEIAWLEFLSELEGVSQLNPFNSEIKRRLKEIIENFSVNDALEIKNIEAEINHDVKAVEYFLIKRLSSIGIEDRDLPFIHFGCTSEDVNNLSYALMLKEVRENILAKSLNNLIIEINNRAKKYSDMPMLSRTHGQAATPTTIGKEFSIYSYRLKKQLDKFKNIEIYGKMNGAVGNYNAHNIAYPNINWPEVTKKFIESFGVLQATHTTQIESHDWMSEYMQSIIRFNIVSIDLCQDMWSYISLGYFKSMVNKKEVGSSTMPHKVNPIDFENAEGNFGLSNSSLGFLSNKLPQSRWQRDLTDSTCLRNLAVGISHSLIAIQSCLVGMSKLEPNIELISSDLEDNYELLAEAIQTVMRKYNIPSAYEQLKELTRGKKVTQAKIKDFINSIDGLSSNDKQILAALSPKDYIGLASELACSVKVEK
tara:strand:- start:22402 stop:23790 length:1389 start_codon:yes stop_codon:yes gene_type:complete